MPEFLQVVKRLGADELEQWLIANASRMAEEMFSQPDLKWNCEPYQILTLRAFAPDDVFTEEAKELFLEQVGDDESLADLADALFGDDQDLLSCLPEEHAMLSDYLELSMKKAYEHDIREAG